MKRILAALSLLVLAACSSPTIAPVTTQSIDGTVPGSLDMTSGYVVFARITVYGLTYPDPDSTLTLTGPNFAGEIASDGTFTVDLPTPDASDLIPFCNTGAKFTWAGAAMVSTVEHPQKAGDIVADIALTFDGYSVGWLYADRAFRYSGSCSPFTPDTPFDININVAQGWNLVVGHTGAFEFETRPVPAAASWTVN